eukprot:351465-Chlamydomonas_euryale.AAC.4
MDLPKYVFTNADAKHAAICLRLLGIEDAFQVSTRRAGSRALERRRSNGDDDARGSEGTSALSCRRPGVRPARALGEVVCGTGRKQGQARAADVCTCVRAGRPALASARVLERMLHGLPGVCRALTTVYAPHAPTQGVFHFENLHELADAAGIDTPEHPAVVCKPSHRAYELVFAKIGVPASEVLFFDDSMRNVKAAQEVGAMTVLVRGRCFACHARACLGSSTACTASCPSFCTAATAWAGWQLTRPRACCFTLLH